MFNPVATCKQISASVAEGGSVPFGAQMHAGEQLRISVATCRMNRQSVTVGFDPELTGCEQTGASGTVDVVVLDEEVELDDDVLLVVVATPTHPISVGST